MGSLYVLGNSKFGFSSLFFVYMAFVSVLLIISAVDLQTHNVPDALIITGIALGWMAGTFLTTSGIRDSTIGLLIGGGGFLSVAVATNGKLGGGDVKLAAMIGAILGWKAALTGFAIGIAAGSATGAVLLALKRVKRNTPIPFTPFLSAGSIVAIMKGREIMNWYIGRFQP
jgi:leader peptidase (prepilin peptidase)/N-methyltransferase